MVYELTQDNFIDEIENCKIPVLVDMYAGWCGSCRNMSGIIDAIAAEYEGDIKVCKLDINAAPQIAAQYKIKAIPTCILFQEGDMKARTVGVMHKHELEEEIGIMKDI